MSWRRIERCCWSSLEDAVNRRCRPKPHPRWMSTSNPSLVQTLNHISQNESTKFNKNVFILRWRIWKKTRLLTRTYSTKARSHSEKRHKDLYAIIGVSPHATQVQIKKAYYRLSMKYHPDRNKGSVDAHKKFTELTEAYSILGQYELRRKYDKGMLHQYRQHPSHTHSDHYTHVHHSGGSSHSSRGGASTVHGKKSRFDFDEFYRAHYGEALRREQESRRKRAAAKERAKHYSISDSWHQVLIMGVSVSVLLVGWYGSGWRKQWSNRTATGGHDQG